MDVFDRRVDIRCRRRLVAMEHTDTDLGDDLTHPFPYVFEHCTRTDRPTMR